MKVIKRNGSEVDFDSSKIIVAITKANEASLHREMTEEQIREAAEYIAYKCEKMNRERRKIGMIFQQFNLFATRTVLDNVAYPLRFSGMSRRDIREKAESLLRYVELEDKRDAYPSQLSGGQKQRVAIACVRRHV